MIGILPAHKLAPQEYRYALDAAMPILSSNFPVRVWCRQPELEAEVFQRLPLLTQVEQAATGLWVEPMQDSWRIDLAQLALTLKPGASLVVLASRPLARLLPERYQWIGRPLGMQPGGLYRLRRSLKLAGFSIKENFGIHSATAIGLNLISQQLEKRGYAALADRFNSAARLHYRANILLAPLSTLALLIATKEQV